VLLSHWIVARQSVSVVLVAAIVLVKCPQAWNQISQMSVLVLLDCLGDGLWVGTDLGGHVGGEVRKIVRVLVTHANFRWMCARVNF
jgi:hypothetical protein